MKFLILLTVWIFGRDSSRIFADCSSTGRSCLFAYLATWSNPRTRSQLSTSERGFLKFWVAQILNHLTAAYIHVDRFAFLKFFKPSFGSLIFFIRPPRSNSIHEERECPLLRAISQTLFTHTTTTS